MIDAVARSHDFPDESRPSDDKQPIRIKSYLAYCPCCNETFPYHQYLFPNCPNPLCPGRESR
jgi:hypothetical protein